MRGDGSSRETDTVSPETDELAELTPEQRERLAMLEAMTSEERLAWLAQQPEDDIDLSDIPDMSELMASTPPRRGPRLLSEEEERLYRPRKLLVSLRLDADVVEHFRSTGAGWQSRINAALREVAKRG